MKSLNNRTIVLKLQQSGYFLTATAATEVVLYTILTCTILTMTKFEVKSENLSSFLFKEIVWYLEKYIYLPFRQKIRWKDDLVLAVISLCRMWRQAPN